MRCRFGGDGTHHPCALLAQGEAKDDAPSEGLDPDIDVLRWAQLGWSGDDLPDGDIQGARRIRGVNSEGHPVRLDDRNHAVPVRLQGRCMVRRLGGEETCQLLLQTTPS
jgi:hypothetical protein